MLHCFPTYLSDKNEELARYFLGTSCITELTPSLQFLPLVAGYEPRNDTFHYIACVDKQATDLRLSRSGEMLSTYSVTRRAADNSSVCIHHCLEGDAEFALFTDSGGDNCACVEDWSHVAPLRSRLVFAVSPRDLTQTCQPGGGGGGGGGGDGAACPESSDDGYALFCRRGRACAHIRNWLGRSDVAWWGDEAGDPLSWWWSGPAWEQWMNYFPKCLQLGSQVSLSEKKCMQVSTIRCL